MSSSDGDELTAGRATAVIDLDREVELEAFRGRPPTPVKVNRAAPFGWWPAICLAMVALVDRIEFSILAGVLPTLQEEFGFNDTQAGLLSTAASVAGVLLIIPVGRMADRVHRTRTIAIVIVIWSVLTLGTGLAVNYAMLFLVRTLLGAAGLLYNPPSSSLITDYYPGAARTRAFSIERFAHFAGNPIGIIAGGIIAETLGWRWAFAFLIVPGILVALCVTFLKEPIRGLGDRLDAIRDKRPEEIDEAAVLAETNALLAEEVIVDGVAEVPLPEDAHGLPGHVKTSGQDVSVRQDLLALLKIRTLRTILLSLGVVFSVLGGIFYFMPTYFVREFGLADGAAAGIAGMTGLVGMGIGTVVGAKLGDRYHGVRRGWRLTLSAAGLAIGALGVLLAVLTTVIPVIALGLLVANSGFAVAIPNLTAAVADVVPFSRRGMGFAIVQFVTGGISAVGPLLIGVTSDLLGGLRMAFGVVVVILALGAFAALRGRATYDDDVAAIKAGTLV